MLVWIIPVDTRSRFNVYKTLYKRLIDVETKSCVYWDWLKKTHCTNLFPVYFNMTHSWMNSS